MVIRVKDNLLVIRMNVCYLTQWGGSWGMERVCKRGEIRKNCGNRWKKSEAPTLPRMSGESARPICDGPGETQFLMVKTGQCASQTTL